MWPVTRGDPCPTCDKVLTDCFPDPEVLKSLFGKSLWTLLYHFFTYKVFTEHLLCANSFMAYGDESNRPGLCHRDDDLHLCPLPLWDPPSGPSQRWAPSVPTFQMWSSNGRWELGSSLLSLPSGWWPTYMTLNLHSWGGGWAMWTPPFNPHTQKLKDPLAFQDHFHKKWKSLLNWPCLVIYNSPNRAVPPNLGILNPDPLSPLPQHRPHLSPYLFLRTFHPHKTEEFLFF